MRKYIAANSDYYSSSIVLDELLGSRGDILVLEPLLKGLSEKKHKSKHG